MTGLDKIVSKIASDSANECVAILNDARAKAEKIITDARNAARLEADEIISKAKALADKKIAVSKSSAETITRSRYLGVRNAVVNDIISAAYEEIEKMDDAAYFDLLFKLCIKYVETGECVMHLSQRDLDRLPAGFEEQINTTVFEKAAVQISKQPYDIENGFILTYVDFEINCTLKSVFDENMDKLKDMLSLTLFG